MSTVICDVAICGAGVAGLTLAALLGQQGLVVTLIEKQRQFHMTHKGELIQPRSLEILEHAGLLGPLRGGGARKVTALACRTAQGQSLVSLDYRLLTGPFRYGMVQSYREMRGMLAAQLGPTVTMLRGARADDLIRDRDGRISGVMIRDDCGTTKVRATVTIAGDGRASKLRAAAGITVASRQYAHQLVGFELENAPTLGSEMNAYLTGYGLRALFALPGRRARLYVQIPADSFRDVGRAGLPSWTDSLLSTTPVLDVVADSLRASLDSVQVLSAWRFLAPRWIQPGFALIGDAAHSVHPMVGQGMNAAIADARALSDALDRSSSLTPEHADRALIRYERARQAQLLFVARMSNNMAVLLTASSWPGRLLRPGLLRRNQANDQLRQRITQNVAGLTAQPLTIKDWISASGIRHGLSSGRSEGNDEH